MLEFWPNRGNLLHKLAKKRHGGHNTVGTVPTVYKDRSFVQTS